MKTYHGIRRNGTCTVTVSAPVRTAGRRMTMRSRPLNLRLDLFRHSPTGYSWGYGGSGPAQLALALLADVLKDDDRAVQLHQRFKFKAIGSIKTDEWTYTEDELLRIVDTIQTEMAHDAAYARAHTYAEEDD